LKGGFENYWFRPLDKNWGLGLRKSLVNIYYYFYCFFDKMSGGPQFPTIKRDFNQENQNNQDNQFQQNNEQVEGGKRRRKSSRRMKKGGISVGVLATGALVLGNELLKRRTSSRMGKSGYRKSRRFSRSRRSTRRRR
jgi:hypothetical protein